MSSSPKHEYKDQKKKKKQNKKQNTLLDMYKGAEEWTSQNSEYTKTQTDVSDFALCNKSPAQVISSSPLHLIVQLSLLVALAGLKGHLQDLVSEPVAVQAGDGHGRLLVVRHGNEAEALALVGVEVADHLHVGDGAEGAEHLPEDALVGVLAQVVDEDAPAGGGVARDANAAHAAHVVNTHGGEPGNENI